jgi:hypothetical protein
MKVNRFIEKVRIAVAAAVLLSTQSLRADKEVISPVFGLPVQVSVVVDESECRNSRGPKITLGGEISLGAVNARLTFSNNVKGTHKVQVVARYTVSLVAEGDVIEIPKQPVRGGVGGNPHIYLQFHDGNGNDLSDEFYLGRCVQGLEVTTDLLQEAAMRAKVHAEGCSNRKGPFITLDGTLVLGGLHARIIFRNNLKGTHTAEDSRDVAIVMEGTEIVLPKQPVLGGVGGNPIISIQFLKGDGTAIGAPVVLGRCVQL